MRARRGSPRTRCALSRGEHLPYQGPITLHRDDAVGLLLDVGTPTSAHLREVEPTLRRGADRAREEVGTRGRDHDAAADLAHEAGRLARLVRSDDHGAAGREDPVQATRDDIAGEALRETD